MGKTYKNLTTGTDNITKPRNMMIAWVSHVLV